MTALAWAPYGPVFSGAQVTPSYSQDLPSFYIMHHGSSWHMVVPGREASMLPVDPMSNDPKETLQDQLLNTICAANGLPKLFGKYQKLVIGRDVVFCVPIFPK